MSNFHQKLVVYAECKREALKDHNFHKTCLYIERGLPEFESIPGWRARLDRRAKRRTKRLARVGL